MVEKNRGVTDQIETSQRDDHMECDSAVTEMELVIRKVTVTDRDSDGDIVGHDYSERDSDSNRERDRESDSE